MTAADAAVTVTCTAPGVPEPVSAACEITVSYQDESFLPHTNTFRGYPAQIIQHECDHCEGILI